MIVLAYDTCMHSHTHSPPQPKHPTPQAHVNREKPSCISSNILSEFSSLCMQFPITAIREIKILKKLQHENVIKLKEIVTSPGIVVLVVSISSNNLNP